MVNTGLAAWPWKLALFFLAWSAVQLFVHGSQTADNVKHICWYAWSIYKLKGKFLFIYSSWTLSLKNDHHSFCMAEYYYSKRISAWALIDTILQLRWMVEAMVTSVFKQERSVPVKSFSTPPRAFQQWRSKNPNNDVGHYENTLWYSFHLKLLVIDA